MRKWKRGLLVFTIAVALVGCGKANTGVGNISDVDSQVSDNAFESTTSTEQGAVSTAETEATNSDITGNTNDTGAEVVEEKQVVGKVELAVQNGETDVASVTVPIEDTELGSWLKTPKGFMLKSKETSDFVRNSVVVVGDNHYYFDTDGYLQPTAFVKDKGKLWYLQDCKEVYGFISYSGNTYYADKTQGVLTLCTAKIDGEIYYFDSTGKSITQAEFNELNTNE